MVNTSPNRKLKGKRRAFVHLYTPRAFVLLYTPTAFVHLYTPRAFVHLYTSIETAQHMWLGYRYRFGAYVLSISNNP